MEKQPPLIYIEKIEYHYHNHIDTTDILNNLQLIKQKLHIMGANTDKALADLAEIKTSLSKIGSETATLLQKITDLENAANNADTPQAVLDAIAEVKTAAQAVDDAVPDAETPPPTEG